jgi:hypothetical protein
MVFHTKVLSSQIYIGVVTPVLGLTQPDTGGKVTRAEADHSPPNNAVIKKTGIYISTPS